MSDERNFYHPTCYLHPAWKRQRNEVEIVVHCQMNFIVKFIDSYLLSIFIDMLQIWTLVLQFWTNRCYNFGL